MTVEERPPLPPLAVDDEDPLCPQCGGIASLRYGAYVFTFQHLAVRPEGLIVLAGPEYVFEDTHDDHIYCTECMTQWAEPKDLDFE